MKEPQTASVQTQANLLFLLDQLDQKGVDDFPGAEEILGRVGHDNFSEEEARLLCDLAESYLNEREHASR